MATIIRHTLPVVDEIAAAMEERGLSVRQVAPMLDVSPSTIHNWLQAKVTPPLNAETQARIAMFLEVSPRRVVELFGLDLDSDASGP